MLKIVNSLTLALNRASSRLHIGRAWKSNRCINLSCRVLHSVHVSFINDSWPQKKLATVNAAFKRIQVQCIEVLYVYRIIHLLLSQVLSHLHHFILLFIFQSDSKLLVAGFYWWYCSSWFWMLILLSKKNRLLILLFFAYLVYLFILIIFFLVNSSLVIIVDGICRNPSSHHCFHI